jgi:hypothetical protein
MFLVITFRFEDQVIYDFLVFSIYKEGILNKFFTLRPPILGILIVDLDIKINRKVYYYYIKKIIL